MKPVASATIGIQSRNEQGKLVPFRRVEHGKDSFMLSGDHEVTLVELADGHESEMRFELRITHPHPQGRAPDEVMRFNDEELALSHFAGYCDVLAKQNHRDADALPPLTLPGKRTE